MRPIKMVAGDGDLGAAGGHDPPAEPLFGGEGGEPAQVHPQESDGLCQQGLEVGIHFLATVAHMFQLWHHLTTQHVHHQQVELVPVIRNGGLSGRSVHVRVWLVRGGVSHQYGGHFCQKAAFEGIPVDVAVKEVRELCPDFLRIMIIFTLHYTG